MAIHRDLNRPATTPRSKAFLVARDTGDKVGRSEVSNVVSGTMTLTPTSAGTESPSEPSLAPGDAH
jgi:hypothetical protein